jgi:hypothetical protein
VLIPTLHFTKIKSHDPLTPKFQVKLISKSFLTLVRKSIALLQEVGFAHLAEGDPKCPIMGVLEEWTDEEKVFAIETVTEAFPREIAMYDAYGCEHPYSKDGLGDAIRLAQFDYMQLLSEVLTEGEFIQPGDVLDWVDVEFDSLLPQAIFIITGRKA